MVGNINNHIAGSFYNLGKKIIKHEGASEIVGMRRFKSFFGVSPLICAICWQHIKSNLPMGYKEVHLLWALLFLKCYNTESINHCIAECDEKTFRKRVWIVVEELAVMQVIKWEDRKICANQGQTCFTSLDGVDFPINEPSPFSPKWYSHKFHAAGLRYEIGLCVRTGHVVWAYGGFACGDWPDINIARRLFVQFLDRNEKTLADKGYNDASYFIQSREGSRRRHKRIMSRHETINKWIKQFNVLCEPFRHPLHKHKLCFHRVINITQLIIKYEEPLFSV